MLPLPDEDVRSLVAGSASSQEVLDKLAARIAQMWSATGCSIYFFDESTRLLSLRARFGCPAGRSVGFTLPPGTSFIGKALENEQFRYTTDITAEPDFATRENIEEVASNCVFLAMPILHGSEHIGVLVLHRPRGTGFSQDEISQIRSATRQLGAAIENVRALRLASSANRSAASAASGAPAAALAAVYQGSAVIPSGVASGRSHVLGRHRVVASLEEIKSGEVTPREACTLDEAIERTRADIERLQSDLAARLPEAATMLFESQLLMLKDDTFVGPIRALAADGAPAARAVAETALGFISFFRNSPHDYLREKAQDVEDLALSLLYNLSHRSRRAFSQDAGAGEIVVSSELLPSDILRVANEHFQGIVLVGSASTAHITLLVRSLRIPMVIVKDSALLSLPDGVPLILDCATGQVHVRPSAEVRAAYAGRQARESGAADSARPLAAPPVSATADGCRISFLANINLLAELDRAVANGAEGVGLYRTEFPYLIRQSLPTEDEQLAIYLRLLDGMPDRPVTFRTLDVGGDKMLAYFDQAREENPALGLRSIRFTLKYPFLFDQQLRSILRAVRLRQRRDVRIMFPMIGSLEGFAKARARVVHCIEHLRDTEPMAALPVIEPEIGTMVELPSLVFLARQLAEEAAFFSIGTNDFIQYMLAADRTNAQVQGYYVPHHPAVLQGLAAIVRAVNEVGRPVSVCGEMGNDPRYIPFFIGLGVRCFSTDPGGIPRNREFVSRLTLAQCEDYARSLLACSRLADIESTISRFSP